MAYTLSKKVAHKLGGQEHTNITIISFFSLTDKKSIYAISQTLLILKNVKKLLLSSFPVSQREEILDDRMKDLKQGFCKVSYSALHSLTPNNLIYDIVWKSLQSTFEIISEHRIREQNMLHDEYYWTVKRYYNSLVTVHIS